MFHVHDFLVAFDMAPDEGLGFLADAELLMSQLSFSSELCVERFS